MKTVRGVLISFNLGVAELECFNLWRGVLKMYAAGINGKLAGY